MGAVDRDSLRHHGRTPSRSRVEELHRRLALRQGRDVGHDEHIGPIEHGSDLFLRDRTMQLDALPELVEQPRQIGARSAAEARIPARPIDVEAPVGERSHHGGDELGIESLRQGPDEHQ